MLSVTKLEKEGDQMTTSKEHFNQDGGQEVPAWLLDYSDEEAGREEQPLPTFDLQ